MESYPHKKFILDIVHASAIIATMCFIGYQALITRQSVDEMAKSTELLKYEIEIQNQPFVFLNDFYYYYNPNDQFINIFCKQFSQGKIPAYNFRRGKDLLFYIETSKFKVNSWIEHKEKEMAELKLSHYYLGLRENILNYIENHPDINRGSLIEYLTEIKKKPLKYTATDLKNIDIVLEFDDFNVYEDIKEYRLPKFVFPNSVIVPSRFSRKQSYDIIDDIKNHKKIMYYYKCVEYEGLNKDRKLQTHFYGYIDGNTCNEDVMTVDKKEQTVYEINNYREWTTRIDFP